MGGTKDAGGYVDYSGLSWYVEVGVAVAISTSRNRGRLSIILSNKGKVVDFCVVQYSTVQYSERLVSRSRRAEQSRAGQGPDKTGTGRGQSSIPTRIPTTNNESNNQ